MLELTLLGYVPDSRLSLNGRRRTHWTTVRKLQAEAATLLIDAVGGWRRRKRRELPRFEHAAIDITFVYPVHRRRDPDGLAGLAKPLLDQLVAYQIIPDDDQAHISLTVAAAVEPETTETRIRVAEKPILQA